MNTKLASLPNSTKTALKRLLARDVADFEGFGSECADALGLVVAWPMPTHYTLKEKAFSLFDTLAGRGVTAEQMITMAENVPLHGLAHSMRQVLNSSSPNTPTPGGGGVGGEFSFASQTQKPLSVYELHYGSQCAHFRDIIYATMNETGTWIAFLKGRNLLSGQAAERRVASLRNDFEVHKRGNPMSSVMEDLCQDRSFATTDLDVFCGELIALGNHSVTTEVVKLQSWIAAQKQTKESRNQTAFDAQSQLRQWLTHHRICDPADVDSLLMRLRGEGVGTVADLAGFTKQDLKECGFTTVQAIRAEKALEKRH